MDKRSDVVQIAPSGNAGKGRYERRCRYHRQRLLRQDWNQGVDSAVSFFGGSMSSRETPSHMTIGLATSTDE